jgi:transforming growth factor-beta-induced protein
MKKMLLSAALGAAMIALPSLAQAQTAANPAARTDIVSVAVNAGNFTTLVRAVQAAGLEETLRGTGPFTVFAPTDEAFAKLPAGALDALIANPEQLRAVLTYHVVPGRVMAADVIRAGSAQPNTVMGQPLRIRVEDGKVRVNDATVVAADVNASNGVIHAVDSVILPRMSGSND